MSEEVKTPANPRDALKLKLPEPDVSTEQPWDDDVLGRAKIAERLTNLIQNQSAPFVVSIHGQWGTGKTFLLKRWQKDLESQKFKAIYFNAWEDDFCDDPLLAIISQLSDYFKEAGLKKVARKAAEIAMPLIKENLFGVLKATTGVTIKVDQQEQGNKTFLDAYLEQRATKDKLKNQLAEMSAKIVNKTGHPMVFIIDELDRCRPTFAIELLERVKHIFDVPNLVFVLGINRDELCKSLQSIYGEIDADVYLRRFFDMEFTLPEVDSAKFGRHLMQKFELGTFFGSFSRAANTDIHEAEYHHLAKYFPPLWDRLGLSLRDIDYCVRLIALVGTNLEPRQHMYPWLLGILIPLQLKNPTLYREFIQGDCLGSEVMNFIDKIVPAPSQYSELETVLDRTEVFLYSFSYDGARPSHGLPAALGQLKLLGNGDQLTYPEYLSERTKESDPSRIAELMSIMSAPNISSAPSNISHLAKLIGLHQELVRR